MSVFDIAAAIAIALALLLLVDRHSLVTEMRRTRREVKKLRKALALGERPTKRTSIPPFVRRKVIERCDRTCQWCGRQGDSERDADGEKWHVDHVIPLSKGGPNHIGNYTLMCQRCNLRKGNRFPASLLAGVEWKVPADLETPAGWHEHDVDTSSRSPLIADVTNSADEDDNSSEDSQSPANVTPAKFIGEVDTILDEAALTKIPGRRAPDAVEAGRMRHHYALYGSKTRLCKDFYGYKDDDIWAFVNAALENRI